MSLHGRVEGEENGGGVKQDGHGRDDHANNHQPETDPIQLGVAQFSLETVDGGKGEETDDKEGRPDQGVEDAVHGQPLVVALNAEIL
jgi:hypothetical protein